MIAPELVKKLQRLNREEKLQVVRFLNDELSDDIDMYFEGARVFRNIPPIRASEETIKQFETLSKELNTDG